MAPPEKFLEEIVIEATGLTIEEVSLQLLRHAAGKIVSHGFLDSYYQTRFGVFRIMYWDSDSTALTAATPGGTADIPVMAWVHKIPDAAISYMYRIERVRDFPSGNTLNRFRPRNFR